MKYFYLIILSSISLLLSSCQKEANRITLDEELEVYYLRFQQEATSRGITVDFEQTPIEGYIQDIETEDASGACQHSEPSFIVVDEEWWNAASDMDKEFLIFHELGHCYLLREHLDTQNPDGSCASIMHSSSSVCQNKYNLLTRSAYLDELFLP